MMPDCSLFWINLFWSWICVYLNSPCLKTLLTAALLSLSAAEPLPLMDLCRRAARLALGRERLQEIETLPLPQSLKNYLQYQWERERRTRTQRGSLRRWYSATLRPQREMFTLWLTGGILSSFFLFQFLFLLFMSCLNYWWLWKKLGVRSTDLQRLQVYVSPCTSRHFRKHINLGMPLKAHSNNRSSLPGWEHSKRTQEAEAAGGQAQNPPNGSPEEERRRRCLYLRPRPPGDSNMTDGSHFFPFFLGYMDVYSHGHTCTHTQSHTDFTSFCSLWAWVTFLSDFTVSVRISVDDYLLNFIYQVLVPF